MVFARPHLGVLCLWGSGGRRDGPWIFLIVSFLYEYLVKISTDSLAFILLYYSFYAQLLLLSFPFLSMSFIFIIWRMTWWSLLLPQLAWYQSDPPARETPVISHSSPVCHSPYQFTIVSQPVPRLSPGSDPILFGLFYSVSNTQGNMVNGKYGKRW